MRNYTPYITLFDNGANYEVEIIVPVPSGSMDDISAASGYDAVQTDPAITARTIDISINNTGAPCTCVRSTTCSIPNAALGPSETEICVEVTHNGSKKKGKSNWASTN